MAFKHIPRSFIEDLLTRVDIIEILSERLSLTKRGRDFLTRCPFHEEKTPSFTASQPKQFYYCFGCGAHGNAIDFLIAYDRLTFPESIELLAARCGLEVPCGAFHPVDFSKDYEVIERINDFYKASLRKNERAIQYLKGRGISGQIAKQFELGYAPNDFNHLKHFEHDPEIKALLKTHGLLIEKEGRTYPRFRHRIVFPIRNVKGHLIGFGARVLENEQPKYMNSPETPLFHKGESLYGLYQVIKQHRTIDQIVIVEGYMDVISLHQFDISYAVATLGTATTHHHLQLIFRYTKKIIFCFDGDEAGKRAAWKALVLSLNLLKEGLQVYFLYLPPEDDPDSLIRRVNTLGFQQRLNKAEPLSEVFFKALKSKIYPDTPDKKAAFAKEACQYLNQMPQGLFKELLFEELARHLKIYKKDLDSLLEFPKNYQQPSIKANVIPKSKFRLPAYRAIALILQEPKLVLEIPSLEAIEKLLSVEGTALLVKLVKLINKNPTISMAALLLEAEEESATLAQLAALPQLIPAEALLIEFQDILQKLVYQNNENLTTALIEKAKQSTLSEEEKKALQALLISTKT